MNNEELVLELNGKKPFVYLINDYYYAIGSGVFHLFKKDCNVNTYLNEYKNRPNRKNILRLLRLAYLHRYDKEDLEVKVATDNLIEKLDDISKENLVEQIKTFEKNHAEYIS